MVGNKGGRGTRRRPGSGTQGAELPKLRVVKDGATEKAIEPRRSHPELPKGATVIERICYCSERTMSALWCLKGCGPGSSFSELLWDARLWSETLGQVRSFTHVWRGIIPKDIVDI